MIESVGINKYNQECDASHFEIMCFDHIRAIYNNLFRMKLVRYEKTIGYNITDIPDILQIRSYYFSQKNHLTFYWFDNYSENVSIGKLFPARSDSTYHLSSAWCVVYNDIISWVEDFTQKSIGELTDNDFHYI